VKLGIAIAQARAARAAIDLSDGLADAAHQLAEASNCGIEVDGALVPIEEGARGWWAKRGRDPLTSALSGGDDYELLFAVPRNRTGQLRHARSRVATPALTRIGVLTRDRSARVLLRDGRKESLPAGFAHWREGK
jgi:thiamine-monophosphate kinase